MTSFVYLDHAATSPLRQRARMAMTELMANPDTWANASSLHAPGRNARRLLEEQRESISQRLGARPSEVVFTSGGTEADNLALKGAFRARRAEDPRRIVILISAVEHHAVLDAAQGLEAEGAVVGIIEADRLGEITAEAVAAKIAEYGPEAIAVIAVMWANNEVGTVNDIPAIGEVAGEHGIPLHSDAVQAAGHIPVDYAESGATTIAVAAHKFGGPVGIGALLVSREARIAPLLHGGGHERGLRAGTANVIAAVGMGSALEEAVQRLEPERAHVSELRDRLWQGIRRTIPGVVLNGKLRAELGIEAQAAGLQDSGLPGNGARMVSGQALARPGELPGILNVTFPGAEGDSLLMLLDAQGICCSTGSACTAGVAAVSHVIAAMGVPDEIGRGTLRFSLAASNTAADVEAALAALPEVVERARAAGLASGATLTRNVDAIIPDGGGI